MNASCSASTSPADEASTSTCAPDAIGVGMRPGASRAISAVAASSPPGASSMSR
jgi:hypothetical protein